MPNTQKEKLDALLRRMKIRNDVERNKQAAVHKNAEEAERLGK